MPSANEENVKLSKRYTLLAIVSAFLVALFWSLGSFFFWIFFGAGAYFSFLAYYHRPQTEDDENKFEFIRSSWKEQTQDAPIQVSQKNVKLIIAVSVISMIGLLLIMAIIGIATGNSQSTTNETISNQDNLTLLSEDPTNIDALITVGNGFYSTDQYDSALVYYDRVLNIDARNSSGLYNKGLTLYQKKQYQKSVDILRQCISLYPDNTDAIMVLGDNYYSQDQFIQAMEWYKQAYARGARSAGLLNVMAYIYDQQNQKVEAIRFYKETLQQDSSLVDVYNRLAELEPGYADWYRKKAAARK